MRRRPFVALACGIAALTFALPSTAATTKHRSGTRRYAKPPELVWHVESLDGRVLDSKNADLAINPASVIKVATTWWALDRLGPEHRFTTRIYANGPVDPKTGMLAGDLVVRGDGDPDFQSQNAFLVAIALRDLGIRAVRGSVVVDGSFWMGWENGSQGRKTDAAARATLMASRLRGALDVRRWSRAQRSMWNEFIARRGPPRTFPSLTIYGGARYDATPDGSLTLLFEHVSKPLAETLRRFNCFSNNDIERVAASIGPPSELAVLLADHLAPGATPVKITTASGLGENRLSPRQIVALLRAFRDEAQTRGLPIEGLLPVAGCDPGTVAASFPRLSAEPIATAVVAKTGTLTSTDGGVTVLAGFLNTTQGEVVFCVAVPNAGGRIRLARHTEESFVLDLISRRGGPAPRTCAPPLSSADDESTILGSPVGAGGTGASR